MKKTINVECYRLLVPVLSAALTVIAALSLAFFRICEKPLLILGCVSAAALFVILVVGACLSIEHSCAIIFCPCCVWQSAEPGSIPTARQRTQIESALQENAPTPFVPEHMSIDETHLQLPPLYSPKTTVSSTMERRLFPMRSELRK